MLPWSARITAMSNSSYGWGSSSIGSVACAAVAMTAHGFSSPVTLDVPGGTLRVEWSPGERATLIGDAVVEFSSTFG